MAKPMPMAEKLASNMLRDRKMAVEILKHLLHDDEIRCTVRALVRPLEPTAA